MYDRIDHQKYQHYYRLKRISWFFNTPLASPQGGAWEWLIHSVRRLLSDPWQPPNKTVSCDALRRMLAGLQRILNARPHTLVRSNVEVCVAISPSSLIHPNATEPTIKIRNLREGDLVLITDQVSAWSQYSLEHVIKVHADKEGVVHHITVYTANCNQLHLEMEPGRRTIGRDTTKLALIEYPDIIILL